jgi:Domain of unknown function (DUF4333)
LSTPRDSNQPPWPQSPNPGPDPRQRPGSPQAQNPLSQQPTQWAQVPPRPGPAQPQRGQPPGQWAQPPKQYGQPPGQVRQPSPPPVLPSKPKSRGSKNKPFIIAGALIAVIIVGAIAIVVISKTVNQDIKKIAVAGVQTEIPQILADRTTGYNSDDIKDVKCNNGQDPTAKKGQDFTCDVTVRGKPHKLTVTFVDGDGTYEVGLPQLVGGK